MWRITKRGFTLDQMLLMAFMNSISRSTVTKYFGGGNTSDFGHGRTSR